MLLAVYNSSHAAFWYMHQFNTIIDCYIRTCSVHQAKICPIELSNAMDTFAFCCIKKGSMGEECDALW